MELTKWARLGGQQAMGTGMFPSPWDWDYRHRLLHLAFHVDARGPNPGSHADSARTLLCELSSWPNFVDSHCSFLCLKGYQ